MFMYSGCFVSNSWSKPLFLLPLFAFQPPQTSFDYHHLVDCQHDSCYRDQDQFLGFLGTSDRPHQFLHRDSEPEAALVTIGTGGRGFDP